MKKRKSSWSIRLITGALVIAALGARGTSQIHDLRHIRRGYAGLERDLSALGADIRLEP